MKVKLFDGFNNVVLRTGDYPTEVGWLVLCGRAVGGGGGGGVSDVVMWANSFYVRDVGEGIWIFWAISLEFGEKGEDVWVGWSSSLEVCEEGDCC